MTAIVLWFVTAGSCLAYLHQRRGIHVSPHGAAVHWTHEQWIRRGVAIGLGAYALLKLLLAVVEGGVFRSW